MTSSDCCKQVKAENPEAEARYLRLEEQVQAKNPELIALSNEELDILYLTYHQKVEKCLEAFEAMQSSFIKRAEECIKDLRNMADEVDKFHKGSTIANMTGSSIGIAGGITTIVGLCLAPVTFGASLIVTGVGLGVATAGGVTGATAFIADEVKIKKICNRVEESMKKINEGKEEIQDLLETIEITGHKIINIEFLLNTKRDDPNGGKKRTRGRIDALLNQILLRLLASFLGFIVRSTPLAARGASIAARGASIAARGAQSAAAVTGVLTVALMLLDIGFLTKGAMDIKKGAKSEEAKQIRAIADELKVFCKHLKRFGKAFLQNG